MNAPELIFKYLSGNATDAEVARLEQWVAADPAHREQFMEQKKTWMLAGLREGTEAVDVAEAWREIDHLISESAKIHSLSPPKKRSGQVWFRVAAALLVLAVASIWIWRSKDKMAGTNIATETEVVHQTLPDGSQITLNKYSSITYRERKGGGYREVALTGDAFFQVVRDTATPFIIQAQELEIEVLGTSFYVDARMEEKLTQVIVQSGSVAVRGGDQTMVLRDNETGTFDRNTRILSKTPNDDRNYLGWQTNTLTFEGSALDEVVFALNRHFHAQISIENPALKDCELTATYTDKSLASILRIIEKTLGIQTREDGDRILISGSRCE